MRHFSSTTSTFTRQRLVRFRWDATSLSARRLFFDVLHIVALLFYVRRLRGHTVTTSATRGILKTREWIKQWLASDGLRRRSICGRTAKCHWRHRKGGSTNPVTSLFIATALDENRSCKNVMHNLGQMQTRRRKLVNLWRQQRSLFHGELRLVQLYQVVQWLHFYHLRYFYHWFSESFW